MMIQPEDLDAWATRRVIETIVRKFRQLDGLDARPCDKPNMSRWRARVRVGDTHYSCIGEHDSYNWTEGSDLDQWFTRELVDTICASLELPSDPRMLRGCDPSDVLDLIGEAGSW